MEELLKAVELFLDKNNGIFVNGMGELSIEYYKAISRLQKENENIAPTPKFKVGDEVITNFIKEHFVSEIPKINDGKKGIITSISKFGDYKVHDFFWRESALTLVKKEDKWEPKKHEIVLVKYLDNEDWKPKEFHSMAEDGRFNCYNHTSVNGYIPYKYCKKRDNWGIENTTTWEPKAGDDVEVSDNVVKKWFKSRFVAMCPTGRFITYNEGDAKSYPWEFCRPLQEEPKKMVKYNVWGNEIGAFWVVKEGFVCELGWKIVHSFELPE